ncbi:MAG: OmpH family outer membrane protein [Victivallaceae bacterium]|jgi:outer membrane protein
MKKIALCLALFALCCTNYAGETKIAVLDMDQIFQNYYKTKIADSTLKQQAEIYKAWIKKLNESLTKLEEEFKVVRDASQNIALSASERETKRFEAQKKYREIREKQVELEQYTAEKTQQYKQLETQKRDDILAEIAKEVKRRATLEGFTLVIDKSGKTLNGIPSIIYSSPTADITEPVIAELNRGNPDSQKPAAASK